MMGHKICFPLRNKTISLKYSLLSGAPHSKHLTPHSKHLNNDLRKKQVTNSISFIVTLKQRNEDQRVIKPFRTIKTKHIRVIIVILL